METHNTSHPLFFLVAFFFFLLLIFSTPTPVMGRHRFTPSSTGVDDSGKPQVYIVHVRRPENSVFVNDEELGKWYESFLPNTVAESGESRLVYSYSDVFTGFAAWLTEEEVKAMEKMEGFLQAYPDRLLPLLTTHTPDFLGLQLGKGLWGESQLGKGVIIGVLDTGVFARHPSFNDDGMPPPPKKWKGTCDSQVVCNNKIIGARNFRAGAVAGPFGTDDRVGHGTHTASTAAGAFVKNAEVLGKANGTASGMAPLAHLAIYKVCGAAGCNVADIIAGLDAAINDGVDILSISIGGKSVPFHQDGIAIGAFAAMKKGIFVSCAAGNGGPRLGSLSNEAPWILTVAASTMDRSIRSSVQLGDNQVLNGETLFQPDDFPPNPFPLFDPVDTNFTAFCDGSLAGADVKGKIVLCQNGKASISDMARAVKNAGGVALVVLSDPMAGFTTVVDPGIGFPTPNINVFDSLKMIKYLNATRNPTASIKFMGTVLGSSPAPTVAYFSSRGPSLAGPGILKPDISGPGVNVLAAWPFEITSSPGNGSRRNTTNNFFNMISGTSMATPHLSGMAALLKSVHPDWSPAAIKSAMITTSDNLDRSGEPIKDESLLPASFFSMGAGHVSPTKASDPGLVYDLTADDYTSYLCGLNYTDAQVSTVTGRSIKCATSGSISEAELNYPSITVRMKAGSKVSVKRTVTNIGKANSSYSVKVDSVKGVVVSVEPEKLVFSKVNEKKSFTVTFDGSEGEERLLVEGNLEWVSGKQHLVRSPFSVFYLTKE